MFDFAFSVMTRRTLQGPHRMVLGLTCFIAFKVLWSQAQVEPDWTGVQMEEVAFVSLMEMGANQVNDIAAWHDQEMEDEYLLVGCDNGLACFRLLPGSIPA